MTPPRPRQSVAVLALAAALAACGTTVPAGQRSGTAALGSAPADASALGGPGVVPGQDAVGGEAERSAADRTSIPSPTGGVEGQEPGAARVGGSARNRAGTIPTSGPGWDAKNVYLGVTLSSDMQTAFDGAGLQGVNPGDQKEQAQAVADYYNARGGLLGRRLVLRFDDHSTSALNAQPTVEAQAACEKFTRDEPVVAVVNTQTPLDQPNLRACLAKAGIPYFGVSISAIDDQVLRESRDLYIPTIVPTWTRFAPVFVNRLAAQGYFSSWDTTRGAPGTAPAKVGLFFHDDVVTKRTIALVRKAYQAHGHDPAVEFAYTDYASEVSGAVLQMRGAGVTHIFVMDASAFVFAVAAESQQYRPRYAVWTGNGPGVAMELNAPAAQNVGAIGVGTAPPMDVVTVSGELTPGGQLCRAIMAKRGQTFEGKRFAEAFAFSICDSMRLYVESARSSHGLSGLDFLAGASRIGPGFVPGMSFLSGVRSSYPVLPGAGLDLRWETACSCYQYANRTLHRF